MISTSRKLNYVKKHILEVLCVTVGIKDLFEIADKLAPACKINPTSNEMVNIEKSQWGSAKLICFPKLNFEVSNTFSSLVSLL